MFDKLILCATNQKLTAGIWRWGKLRAYQVFENDDIGQRDFRLFLQEHANTTIYLLTDAVEEDFRIETLPHASGKARRELIERKLNHNYRNHTFRAAHFIHREKSKRKDDRYLFVALTNADFLQDWLDIIAAQKAPLMGVYLLPMVSQAMVRRMKLMAPHLLLCEHLNSGLRQSYLHNGRLRISRLAPNPPKEKGQIGYFYLVETEKTRLYLISQRFIARENDLSMVMPTLDTGSGAIICRDIEQEQGIDCRSIDLRTFAAGLNIAPELLHINPELLHMHLLARGNVPDNLAPPGLIKHYQVSSVRHWINAATAALLVAGLAMAGLAYNTSLELAEKTEQAAAETQVQEHLYSEVAKNFPTTPIASTDLQVAAELAQAMDSYAKPPQRMLQALSAALAVMPQVEVNRLRWVLTSDPNLKDSDKSETGAVPAEAAVQKTAFTPDPAALYEVGFVNGEIRNFSGDYRAALASVNKLVAQIKADAQIAEVVVLQAPVNVSSYSSLEGSTADQRAAQMPAANFKLKLILKREAPLT
jgi:hypothetical protein